MPNIKELAKITGYSVGTISKALNDYPDINEKTKEKIKKIATEIGYMPSSFGQSLVTKKSFSVGVVFEEKSGFGLAHPFFGELLSVIKDELEKYGYDLLLMSKHVGTYVNSYLAHCIQKGVDGVIVLSADLDTKNYSELVSSKIPMVLVDLQSEFKNSIYTDNYKGSRDAVKHVIDLNHKDIAYIQGDLNKLTGKERYQGFIDEMNENNIEINNEYLFYAPSYTIEEGYNIALEISKMTNRPSAVVCVADAVAIGLMNGFRDMSIVVPDDISVVGFDDINLASLIRPRLTTIKQDKKQIGMLAVTTLISNITNKTDRPLHIKVAGELIIRDSVKQKE